MGEKHRIPQMLEGSQLLLRVHGGLDHRRQAGGEVGWHSDSEALTRVLRHTGSRARAAVGRDGSQLAEAPRLRGRPPRQSRGEIPSPSGLSFTNIF